MRDYLSANTGLLRNLIWALIPTWDFKSNFRHFFSSFRIGGILERNGYKSRPVKIWRDIGNEMTSNPFSSRFLRERPVAMTNADIRTNECIGMEYGNMSQECSQHKWHFPADFSQSQFGYSLALISHTTPLVWLLAYTGISETFKNTRLSTYVNDFL